MTRNSRWWSLPVVVCCCRRIQDSCCTKVDSVRALRMRALIRCARGKEASKAVRQVGNRQAVNSGAWKWCVYACWGVKLFLMMPRHVSGVEMLSKFLYVRSFESTAWLLNLPSKTVLWSVFPASPFPHSCFSFEGADFTSLQKSLWVRLFSGFTSDYTSNSVRILRFQYKTNKVGLLFFVRLSSVSPTVMVISGSHRCYAPSF